MRPSRILCSILITACLWTVADSKPFGDLLKKSYLNFDFGFKKPDHSLIDKSSVFDALWKKFKVVQTVLSVVGIFTSLSNFATAFTGSQSTDSTSTDVRFGDDVGSSTLFPDVFSASKDNESDPVSISLPTYSGAELDPTEGMLPVNKPSSSGYSTNSLSSSGYSTNSLSSSGYPTNSVSSSGYSILSSVGGEIVDKQLVDGVQIQPDSSNANDGVYSGFQGYTYGPGQRGSRGY